MKKDDEYRAQAADAQAMADRARSDVDRAAWLRIAQGWLGLIRKPLETAEEKFDAQARKDGTGQDDSKSSH